MLQLLFSVAKQKITRTDTLEIYSDAVGQFQAVFTLDDWWDDYSATAQFTYQGTTYNQLLTNGTCTVPPEVLKAGSFAVSVFAVENANIKTANEVNIPVKQSGYKANSEVSEDPTPSIYQQIINALEGKQSDLSITVLNLAEDKLINEIAGGVYRVTAESGKGIVIKETGTVKDRLVNGFLFVNQTTVSQQKVWWYCGTLYEGLGGYSNTVVSGCYSNTVTPVVLNTTLKYETNKEYVDTKETKFPFVEIQTSQFISSDVAQLTNEQWTEITSSSRNTNIIFIKSHAFSPAHIYPAVRSDNNSLQYYSLHFAGTNNKQLYGTSYTLDATNKTITFKVVNYGLEVTSSLSNSSTDLQTPTARSVVDYVGLRKFFVGIYKNGESYSSSESFENASSYLDNAYLRACVLQETNNPDKYFQFYKKTSSEIVFTATHIENNQVVVEQIVFASDETVTMTTKSIS